jgi:hypothetical protein
MAKKKTNGTPVEEKVEHFTRQLRVVLTEKEIAERADRSAHMVAERDGKEEARKAANTAMKSQIEELDAQIRKLSNEVRDKATYEPVECERRYDYRAGTVRELRTDTKVVLELRTMRADERQTSLDLEPPAPNGTAAEGAKLGNAVVDGEPPLPTQKPAKTPSAKGTGKKSKPRARAEARA